MVTGDPCKCSAWRGKVAIIREGTHIDTCTLYECAPPPFIEFATPLYNYMHTCMHAAHTIDRLGWSFSLERAQIGL